MKTRKVRPVLVENNITAKTKPFSVGLTLCNDNKLRIGNPVGKSESRVDIILISLEDEKIEVGDLAYRLSTKVLKNMSKTANWFSCGWRKVIATQDQLSPELIRKLVDEYNNGGMKDFEIEIESKLPFKDGQWVIEQDGYLHDILHVNNLKLVEKLICENCKSIHEDGSIKCYCGSTSLVPIHKDNKVTAKQSEDTWIDFRKLLEYIEILKDIETDQKYVSNLEAFLTKLSKSSTFAHKAHKELQRLSR